MLTAFFKFDPTDLPENTSPDFHEYGTQEVCVLCNYRNEAVDE